MIYAVFWGERDVHFLPSPLQQRMCVVSVQMLFVNIYDKAWSPLPPKPTSGLRFLKLGSRHCINPLA